MNQFKRMAYPYVAWIAVMILAPMLMIVMYAFIEKGNDVTTFRFTISDDLAMVPMTTTRLTDPDQLKLMGKLLDALEDNDDVQNVWHSLENEEDLPE